MILTPETAPAVIERLAQLHAEAFAEGPGRAWTAAEIAALAAPPTGLLLVDDPVRPASMLVLRYVADEAEVLTLAVAPAMRNRGLGRALLDEGLAALAERGATHVFLEVGERNAPASQLYRRAGFLQSGRRAGYYGGRPAEDALLLSKALSVTNGPVR